MALDPTAVGATSGPTEVSWSSFDALLYAVGIGAGHEELAFTTENSADIDQTVYPTFPVVVGYGRRSPMSQIGTFDPAMLVHGRQAVTVHRPLPPDGTATLVDEIVAMYDKGTAAVVETTTTATMDGEPLYTLASSAFIRGAGGWGGERGPSGPRNVVPDRPHDHEVVRSTSRDQAFVYRLSGDRNPLHTDPTFAARGGFDTPILHGLCTFGFTGRALLDAVCDGDVSRFEHVEGRFASPVIPGETLTTRIWNTDTGEAVFTTSAGSGDTERVVIDQGLLRHR